MCCMDGVTEVSWLTTLCIHFARRPSPILVGSESHLLTATPSRGERRGGGRAEGANKNLEKISLTPPTRLTATSRTSPRNIRAASACACMCTCVGILEMGPLEIYTRVCTTRDCCGGVQTPRTRLYTCTRTERCMRTRLYVLYSEPEQLEAALWERASRICLVLLEVSRKREEASHISCFSRSSVRLSACLCVQSPSMEIS